MEELLKIIHLSDGPQGIRKSCCRVMLLTKMTTAKVQMLPETDARVLHFLISFNIIVNLIYVVAH